MLLLLSALLLSAALASNVSVAGDINACFTPNEPEVIELYNVKPYDNIAEGVGARTGGSRMVPPTKSTRGAIVAGSEYGPAVRTAHDRPAAVQWRSYAGARSSEAARPSVHRTCKTSPVGESSPRSPSAASHATTASIAACDGRTSAVTAARDQCFP